MSKIKKLVLFLVEGITDKVALEAIVSNLFDFSTTDIKITYGDITYKDHVTSQTVVEEVGNLITDFIKNEHYLPEDILRIIHIIDTDGAFIPKNNIIQSDDGNLVYDAEFIKCKNVEYFEKRNNKKLALIQRLVGKRKIANIPYQLYFFSRNMEHVFHDVSEELTDAEKMKLADLFTDTYCDDTNEFLKLLNDPKIAVQGTYSDTWKFIFKDTNSLKRYSNFHLAFKQNDATNSND